MGKEVFEQKLVIVFSHLNFNLVYPKYPWEDNVTQRYLENSIPKIQDELVTLLQKRIKELEEIIKKNAK